MDRPDSRGRAVMLRMYIRIYMPVKHAYIIRCNPRSALFTSGGNNSSACGVRACARCHLAAVDVALENRLGVTSTRRTRHAALKKGNYPRHEISPGRTFSRAAGGRGGQGDTWRPSLPRALGERCVCVYVEDTLGREIDLYRVIFLRCPLATRSLVRLWRLWTPLGRERDYTTRFLVAINRANWSAEAAGPRNDDTCHEGCTA